MPYNVVRPHSQLFVFISKGEDESIAFTSLTGQSLVFIRAQYRLPQGERTLPALYVSYGERCVIPPSPIAQLPTSQLSSSTVIGFPQSSQISPNQGISDLASSPLHVPITPLYQIKSLPRISTCEGGGRRERDPGGLRRWRRPEYSARVTVAKSILTRRP